MKTIILLILTLLSACQNNDQIVKANPKAVKAHKARWEEIRSQGQPIKALTQFKDKRSKCMGTVGHAYLLDDYRWLYPISHIDCPKGHQASFEPVLVQEELEKFIAKK